VLEDVKVKLSLCLIKHHDIKIYGGDEVQFQVFLTSAVDAAKWSASRSDRFTPGKTAPGTRWIGDWMGPKAGLDAVKKRILVVQPVA